MSPHMIAQMSDDVARLTLAAMDTDDVKALMAQAHQAEMTAWCDGSGAADVTGPHSVWLKCMVELDKRGDRK